MNVDKFGRTPKIRGNSGPKGPKGDQGPVGEKGKGFNVTENGDYDIQLHKIINCQNPETYYDVTNKIYVDEKVLQLVSSINTKLQSIEENFQLKLSETEAILRDANTNSTIVAVKLQSLEDRLQLKLSETQTIDVNKMYVDKKVESINADLKYLKMYVDEKVEKVTDLLITV